MIATAGHAPDSGLDRRRPFPSGPRRATSVDAEKVDAAEPPAPRRIAGGLAALLTDGAALAAPAPHLSAARAFAAGAGFLPGQIIDRAI